ncbi:MAG TPA: TlpA disulfide reductase family protein [Acidimicrobiales bacterium]|nr:TlpA disulfide reductase family protein [Acidimicrobiales bacterium]
MASRRIPLRAVVASTVLALAAAMAVVVVLGDDDDSEAASAEEAFELNETGELPASVGNVELGALGDEPATTLAEYLGEPVVVNFFASWCTPCLEEMPDLEAVHRDLGDRVTIVGLATTDTEDRALAMVERTGVTYPTYADPGSAVAFFGGTSMPTTVFIDAAGQVVDVSSEKLDEAELRQRISDELGVAA